MSAPDRPAPVPNERLTTLRLATPSKLRPGKPMRRSELADEVNRWLADHRSTTSSVDGEHVGKWERGVVTWPYPHLRAALRAVLGVENDAELGFHQQSSTSLETVDRRGVLGAAVGVGADIVLSRAFHLSDGAAGGGLDLASYLSASTIAYRTMESSTASQTLRPSVDAHLRLTAEIAERDGGTAGFGSLAEIAGLAAWLAVDRVDASAARGHYLRAVAAAQRARNPLLEAYMVGSLGQYAADVGDTVVALAKLKAAAELLDDTAPDSAHAWLCAVYATTHARHGDSGQARVWLQMAESRTRRSDGEPRWPFVFAFSEDKLALHRAITLGRLGDHRSSLVAFGEALPSLTAPKPRALALVEQARVLALSGDVEQASAIALEAVQVGHDLGSERILTAIRDLRRKHLPKTIDTATLDGALDARYDEEEL